VEGYVKVEGELGNDVYAASPHTSYDEDIGLTPYKGSALDLSHVRPPKDVNGYRPEGLKLDA
jgi:hypothetical protein